MKASFPNTPFRRTALLALAALLAGCASVAPDGHRGAVEQLTAGKTGNVQARLPADPALARQRVAELLAQALTADSAVQIALLNNPGLQGAFATLAISDADRVQAGRAPNPHLAVGAFREGSHRIIERAIGFDILGLLALPWRSQWASQQTELAKLQAAQQVVQLAADTRKAWFSAVAAEQTALYLVDAKEAAEAGAELARRMARVGNWPKLRQAREQLTLTEVSAQLARAEQASVAARERLTRLLGLAGAQTGYTLASRLPELPKTPLDGNGIEARAIAQRLDVRSAVDESRYVAASLGLVRTSGFVNAIGIAYERNTSFNNASGEKEIERGPEIELSLPLFDWGDARNARAQAIYLQSVARVGEVAVRARSEAREAWHAYRTAHDLARVQRDEVLPLRKFIADETTLRYNGMFLSVWDLLAEMRSHIAAVNAAIDAQRDFWIAETDLQTALTGTSPGGLQALRGAAPAGASESKEH